MKKLLAISSVIAVSLANTPPIYAGETKTGLKQAGVFSSAAILGAAAGGPLGLILGAMGGAYLGEQIEKADNATFIQQEISESNMYITQLENQLAEFEEETTRSTSRSINDDTSIALDKLEFQVLFHTGMDTLSTRGENRIATLAHFLLEHPSLSIRLTGHADPRGTDEYNNVLSEHRAISVQKALENYGVDTSRIEKRAYGALQSTSSNGNYEAYAQDRRVDIEIFKSEPLESIVLAH